ncbi:MAG: acetate/propionate family kinase [Chloroflexi bacterium]|nr:acetate/propionate family kinase [Chloroflexota bacterium]
MRILVVNSGSSSLKLRVLDEGDQLIASSDLPAIAMAGTDGPESATPDAVRTAIAALGGVDAAGHRVVHGGIEFSAPAIVDDGVVARLEELTELAPLHQPRSVAALRVVRAILPAVPHVACFDTAFHAGLPAAASTYALPRAWRERWPLRRFGFHGLSHAYIARRSAELAGRPAAGLRIVSCHLGAGASLTAIRDGRSIDTTMGFTPLEGLVMATRSGDVDPGLVLWLQQQGGLSVAEIAEGIEHDAGLKGLAGTDDMRQVLAGVAAGDGAAQLACDVYLHRLRAGIAAMAVPLGGVDVLTFTAGVGENAAAIRARAVEGLDFLGVAVDQERNATGTGDREIGVVGGAARVLVVLAREDLEMAANVRSALGGATGTS